MKKSNLSTIILFLMLIIGLSLLVYPSFSNYWNSVTQSKAVASYIEQVIQMDEDQYAEVWQQARAHNHSLRQRDNSYNLTDEQKKSYEAVLNPTGSGVMGYIQIPSINVDLPIYHGTDDTVLQVAVGHLEWTSVPTGGESTHCVVSGHRGLPSARLFTDLDKMAVGDLFMINILDETLTYEVDQVLIVEPTQTEDLLIREGKDLFTLVTCTPYGINSHRLLVRGHRVENLEEAQIVRVTADAMIIEKMVVMPFVLMPILLVMLIALLISTGISKRRKKK